MSLASKILSLKDRALFFQKVRSFFSTRHVLEVDTPILSKTAPIDEHIQIMTVDIGSSQRGYLHSSPEYAMKRLLALGIGDIYQMSHVFRQGEYSPFHNPEFTMVEWYRINMSFLPFIEETVEFIRLFLGPLPSQLLSYRDAFILYAGLDYLYATTDQLLDCAHKHGIDLSTNAPLDKDDLLHLLMGFVIEPNLGRDSILVLTDYPASQAALAQTEQKKDELVAKRFEIYYQGIELANGYLELTNATVQEERFLSAKTKRHEAGHEDLPIDTLFLQALPHLPPCCGVAVGFDRLLLLHQKASSLAEVLPFSWDQI